jgi:hypothetical protein
MDMITIRGARAAPLGIAGYRQCLKRFEIGFQPKSSGGEQA